MNKKISKLGLWLVVVNSVIIIALSYVDAMNAIQCGSSGFAVIPILMIDMPVTFIAMPVMGFISKLVLGLIPLNNTVFIANLYVVIQKSIFATSFLIFGGLQWYGIGWLISKLKQRFFTHKNQR